MKTRLIRAVICISFFGLLGACGLTEEDPGPTTETAHLALNVDIVGDTDITGFRLEAIRVYCAQEMPGPAGQPFVPAESYEAVESLEELLLPGGNATFVDDIYVDESSHLFSDHLFNVSVGCYDLIATPLANENGQTVTSRDCSTATQLSVYAAEDTANEFQLFSQCRGPARTTLDIVVSVNHPPTVDIELEKFVCAGGGVVACATGSDPDNDPIEFEWLGVDPATPMAYLPKPIAPSAQNQDGTWTQCASIATSPTASTYEYRVIARDYGYDNGSFTPIEDIINARQVEQIESQAGKNFLVHGNDRCISGGMAFIGVTMGAAIPALHGAPDPTRGMSVGQATQLTLNAIDWTNPNLLGQPDPRILVVLDNGNSGEDTFDAAYIRDILDNEGFSEVDGITEPVGGLDAADLTGYKIVWFVNPGFPLTSDDSYDALLNFRMNGGGLVVSGDDMTQSNELSGMRLLNEFSFLSYANDNGVTACGENTNNWTGKNYIVEFGPGPHPLLTGLAGGSFPYGNDIDRAVAEGFGETVVGWTRGLQVPGKQNCLVAAEGSRPVITAVAAGTVRP